MRRLAVPALFTVAGIAILVALGIWQLQRLHWKEALIARVASRLDAPPVAAPGPAEWPGLDLAGVEYTPVSVKGHFLNDKEVHVVHTLTEPRGPLGGLGYLVMTPFATEEGWIAYVNRGFVPREKKHDETRKDSLIEGETTVTGLLRQPSERSWFMPGDGVSDNEWFSRAPKLYAEAYGVPASALAPYIIDARFDPTLSSGLPQGGETLVAFPNNHLQYALTWFGLAAALAVVFLAFARSRVRGR